ncbi:MAG: hypothetical protein ABSB74_10495 [Tepidisphaeraceae bacterium]
MFHETYALRPGETIRRVAPPFLPERLDYFRKVQPSRTVNPVALLVLWRDGALQLKNWMYYVRSDGDSGFEAEQLIQSLLKLYPQDIEGDLELARKVIPGDFVANADADIDQYRLALEKLVSETSGRAVSLTFREVPRPVIVFTGTWSPQAPHLIQIYGSQMNNAPTVRVSLGSIDHFAKWVGSWIGESVIVEAAGAPHELSLCGHDRDRAPEALKQAHDPQLVCTHIHEQTGLDWREETRALRRLFVE